MSEKRHAALDASFKRAPPCERELEESPQEVKIIVG